MADDERAVMAAIARRFYLDDVSKTELATEFAMSRFRVARLLQQARETGLVTITINDRADELGGLSDRLRQHLMLDECVVVPAGETETDNRQRLARAAAAEMKRHIREGDLVGLSWGRTLVAIGEELADLAPCTLIQLTGIVGNDFTQSPVDVIRRIADKSSVRTLALFCPLFAGTPEAAAAFRLDPSVRRVIDSYRDLDLAVLSLGSWEPPITQLRSSLVAEDVKELSSAGVRAEMAGIFIRDDGGVVETAVAERRISVTVDDLVRTPRVLAAAGSLPKAPAIAAVARSGLITSLVTDDLTAVELLKFPPVTEQFHARRVGSTTD
jgi:DNA-binding transcriptional regulator LsrR (DeoR family)